MTRPRTVPSTVSIALEKLNLCRVKSDTRDTTVDRRNEPQRRNDQGGGATWMGTDSLAATAEKNSTSGQMSLMTVALNFFRLHLEKRGFSATILRGRAVGQLREGATVVAAVRSCERDGQTEDQPRRRWRPRLVTRHL